jgi:hypothetical protein
VRQQVDDGQAVAHHGIVQLDLGYVVPERTFPVERAVIDERAPTVAAVKATT